MAPQVSNSNYGDIANPENGQVSLARNSEVSSRRESVGLLNETETLKLATGFVTDTLGRVGT